MFGSLVSEACWVVVVCSGVPLAVAAVVGLLLAVVQGVTQIQEQTIVFVAKFVAVGVVLWLCGAELSEAVVHHFRTSLGGIARLGGLAE
jgi:type III secretory pathway component EscS